MRNIKELGLTLEKKWKFYRKSAGRVAIYFFFQVMAEVKLWIEAQRLNPNYSRLK